jgi:ABC-2 type transport system ATP-binding protein
MIEINRLTKRYARGSLAVNNLSLKLGKRITSILGRNGAGKTTLMRMLSTQLLPTSGTASINDLDIIEDVDMIRDIIASIPQEAHPMSIATPYDHVSMYLNARGLPAKEIDTQTEKSLRELELWHVRNTSTGDLSGGMRRKVFVAMALASKAEVIFLDEPTTGLDPISRIEVWSAIKKLKSTILVTTHYMEEAKELSDEVVLIANGQKVAQGTVPALLNRFRGEIRVEGPKGKYRVGTTHISYIKLAEAKKLIGKGYSTKEISLEDLFVIHGGGVLEA